MYELPEHVKLVQKSKAKNPVILVSKWALAFLCWITKGKLDMQYERRTTTQGNTIYLGDGWYFLPHPARYTLLAHEMEHVRQWRRWWLLYPLSYLVNVWTIATVPICFVFGASWYVWIFSILFSFTLPGVASPRAIWEARAFSETIKKKKEIYGFVPARSEYFTGLLTGSQYYFAAPLFKKQIKKYFKEMENEEFRHD
jgi:hypothetical protein